MEIKEFCEKIMGINLLEEQYEFITQLIAIDKYNITWLSRSKSKYL